jgi:phosphopantothenoylcysteine decarboxylase/phosphopantothenate--cysteine ligase
MKVLLGVTGGIAAYKSPEVVRRLVEGGCEVQVVVTRAARAFVGRATFQAVSGRRVRDDLWDEGAEAAMGHIELARWAEVVVVAPATAHFMATLAAGLAGDLLSTLCLATTAPLVLAPAMNQAMWANAAVKANRALLEQRGVRFIGPAYGDQACGDMGAGRMREPTEIVAALFEQSGQPSVRPLAGRKVVVTAGPTREPIDPVRYITNRSSGKMGFAMAAAARDAGADVVLVSGPVVLQTPRGVRRIDVETAQEMYDQVHAAIDGADIFVGCAAISDYRPKAVALQKIKRSAAELDLNLVRSPDTLASVAALAKPPFTVGFAAETDHVAEHARDKLAKKRVDLIAANLVGPDRGFDRETNALTAFWSGGELALGEGSKAQLARRLMDLVTERYAAARGGAQTSTQAS